VHFGTNTKYDKQDQQGKAAFNERNPHPSQSHLQDYFAFSHLQEYKNL
jgi:hypothetical protein